MPKFRQRPTEGRQTVEGGQHKPVISSEQGYDRQEVKLPKPKPPNQRLCVVCGHRTYEVIAKCPKCGLCGMVEEKQ